MLNNWNKVIIEAIFAILQLAVFVFITFFLVFISQESICTRSIVMILYLIMLDVRTINLNNQGGRGIE